MPLPDGSHPEATSDKSSLTSTTVTDVYRALVVYAPSNENTWI